MTRDVEQSIALDNPLEVYFSGERVKGIVTTRVNKILGACVIKALFVGSYTFKNAAGGVHVKNHSTDEVKLDLNGQVSDIAPGVYANSFCFKLDPTSPTSLQCQIGSIAYKVIVSCCYKSGEGPIIKEETEKCFSVIKDLDLNDKPVSLGEFQTQSKRQGRLWSCMMCQGEPLVTLSTKKRAFVGGEKVFVNATIDNNTSHAISQTLIGILQTVKTKGNTKFKQTVVMKERGMVMSHSSAVWLNEYLTIPAVPPSSDDPHISVSYKLFIKLARDAKKDAVLRVPIIIGTVPLDDTMLEANGIELSFLHNGESDTFIPSYVVYRFDSPTQTDPAPGGPTETSV